jgi:Tol biopolymer transport system component
VRAFVVATACVAALALSPSSAGSHAGDEIVWAADGVFAANADGSGVRRLVPVVADEHSDPAWSPDGGTLAFSGRWSDQTDVFLYDAGAGGIPRALAVRGRQVSPRRGRFYSYLLEPSWAPEGRRLAVTDSWTPETLGSTIRITSLDRGRLTSLTPPQRGREDSSPAWSPRGETIAFTRRSEPSYVPVVMLVRPDGRDLRRLTRGASPSWSPDGRRLVLAWGNAIFRIDADGSHRVRLARDLPARGLRLQPRWSPDGRKILYVGREGGVWTMNADGTGHVRVMRVPRDHGGVAWGPG